jgi:hypothetical protein
MVVKLRDLVTHGAVYSLCDASSPDGLCATDEPAGHSLVLESNFGSPVFAASASDWPFYWLFCRLDLNNIFGAWRCAHRDKITFCNDDISSFSLAP